MTFFQYLRACAGLLGITDLCDVVGDAFWFFCYQDGMSPEQAVAKHSKAVRP